MMEIKLYVKGMMCSHCEDRVTKALNMLDGVHACSASAKEHVVHITFDDTKLSVQTIMDTIDEIGYSVSQS